MRSQLCNCDRKSAKKDKEENRVKEWTSEHMWLTCGSQLQPLVVWICIQNSTWKTQQPRQTMDRWIIRCVRLLLEKVRAEIKCHFKHLTGVYRKGAGMPRMSAVWVCPWVKGAHKICAGQQLRLSSFQRIDAGNPHLPISLYRLTEIKYPLQVWGGNQKVPYRQPPPCVCRQLQQRCSCWQLFRKIPCQLLDRMPYKL